MKERKAQNRMIKTLKQSIGLSLTNPKALFLALAFSFSLGAHAQDSAPPALPSPLCDSLRIPDGNTLTFHAYAIGVQIYRWDGATWVFVAPSATLYADPG